MPTTTIETTTTTTATSTTQMYTAAVVEAIAKVQSTLEVLKTKVLENEQVSAAAVKTNALISAATQHAETALTNVRANIPASTSDALAKATLVLAEVKILTSEKYSASLESASKALATALAKVATWKTAVVDFAIQRVSDLDATFQLSSKTVEWAAIASEQIKLLDTKHNIVERVTLKTKEIDEQYSVAATTLGAAKKAQEFGDAWTGARVTPLVDYVTELVTQSYVTGVEGVKLVTDTVVTKAAEQNSVVIESKESSKVKAL